MRGESCGIVLVISLSGKYSVELMPRVGWKRMMQVQETTYTKENKAVGGTVDEKRCI